MKIQLVSCFVVNGIKYYDVHLVIDRKEFALVPVLYSSIDYCWYVKLPNRPLFISPLFSELMSYLCRIIRELFNLL